MTSEFERGMRAAAEWMQKNGRLFTAAECCQALLPPGAPAETAEQWAERMASSELTHMEAINAALPLPVAPAGDREAVAWEVTSRAICDASGRLLGMTSADFAFQLAKGAEAERLRRLQDSERAAIDALMEWHRIGNGRGWADAEGRLKQACAALSRARTGLEVKNV